MEIEGVDIEGAEIEGVEIEGVETEGVGIKGRNFLWEMVETSLPSVSTAGNFLTMVFLLAILMTPRAKVTVTTIGSPSGIAATARLTPRHRQVGDKLLQVVEEQLKQWRLNIEGLRSDKKLNVFVSLSSKEMFIIRQTTGLRCYRDSE